MITVTDRPAPVAVEGELHAGLECGHVDGVTGRDPVDAVEHAVGVDEQRGVVRHLVVHGRPVGTVGVERELAAIAVVEPGHAGGDRHAPVFEQARVAHGDEEPLRVQLAVHAPELGHVGVQRELLARNHEVGEHDGRLDHLPPVDVPRRFDEALVEKERLDALDERPGAVGVLFAEVVGAGSEHGDRFTGPVHAPRLQIVEDGVVALGEAFADLGAALVLRRVHPVPAETLAQPHHALGVGVREERGEQDVLVEAHIFSFAATVAVSPP
jgi:hypothetical protein